MKNLLTDNTRRENLLKSIPTKPGVYLMKNEKNEILYIGKAKSLRSRVRHYFQNTKNHSIGTQIMMPKIHDIECITVSSEIEALLLEINQIKKHTPRYNVIMKDDKSYSFLKITTQTDFPTITTVRKKDDKNALYLGPYMSSTKIEQTLSIIKKLFSYRTCKGTIIWEGNGETLNKPINLSTTALYKKNVTCKNLGRKTPCLDYHIKRCSGPCLGIVSKERYDKNIESIISFLKNDYKEIIEYIKSMMEIAVKERRFEWAANLRDKLLMVEKLESKQRVVNTKDTNQDVIALTFYEGHACISILQIRFGKLIDILYEELQFQKHADLTEILDRFITSYYTKSSDLPKEIILSDPIKTNTETMKKWFLETLKQKLTFTLPQKGSKKDLIKLAIQNGENYIKSKMAKFEKKETKYNFKAIQETLKLEKLPKRIECYDISHTQGTNTVGSMVVMEKGEIKNSDYRRFQVKTISNNVGDPDDFASLKEVLLRRLKYLKENNIKIKIQKISKKSFKKYLPKNFIKKKEEDIFSIYKLSFNDEEIFLTLEELDTKTAIINRYSSSKNISHNIMTEMFITLFYKLSYKHIYISSKKEEENIFTGIGTTKIKEIPTKYSHQKPHSKNIYTWYKTSTKRKKDTSFSSTPDIVVIDGGKGQLSTVYNAVQKMDLPNITFIGLAKKEEEIFLVNAKTPILLPHDSPTIRLLAKIRDEAHRFAITYHRGKRSKEMLGKK